MTRRDFRTELQQRILIGDGAMGTYLYQLGLPVGLCSEDFNMTRPDVIQDIHRRYYDAGAQVIETNTFSANRLKLSKYGLQDDIPAMNHAGVRNAREAVGQEAFVVGAVGSIRSGIRSFIADEALEFAFQEQIHALLGAGVDGLLLETFYDVEEALLALRVARKLTSDPIICQLAIEAGSTNQDGVSLDALWQRLLDEGADVVGLNCRTGPYGIIRALEKLQRSSHYPLSIFPNAGLPAYVDGAFTYSASPEYFGQSAVTLAKLGANLIGGCCGTTPEHIAAIRRALAMENDHDDSIGKIVPMDTQRPLGTIVVSPSAEQSQPTQPNAKDSVDHSVQKPSLLDIVKERHTLLVELDPPRDLAIDKFMLGAQALHAAGVDAITMADNSLAMTRMSNAALGFLIQNRLSARPLVHIACRDRNLIGTQSHLMGLHAMGIDHVLAITGDPARFGDLPGSSSVYDVTSFQMIRMIKQMNEGLSFSGKPLKSKSNFKVGTALNPNVKYLHKSIERLEKKIEAGADFVMTQPVYDPELIVRLYEATEHLQIPIFIGIMPFTSGRNAEYLHNEVPGISLSENVRQRMSGLEGEAGRNVSLEISKEIIDVVMAKFHGIYLITPFMAYEMTVELTRYVRDKAKQGSHLYPLVK
jgi:homocysteine S-methyltransferase